MSTNPYQVDDGQEVDSDFFNGFLGDIDLRLRGVEAQRQDIDAALQGINDLAIFRLNQVLTPAMQTIFDAQHLGFLSAPVAGSAVLGLGASPMTIDAARRHVFTPSPWVALIRDANTDDYAIGRTQSYDQNTGELIVDIQNVAGTPGTYSDVTVWGVAGAALSALESAAQTSADRDTVVADAAQVAIDRAYVASVAADIQDGPVLSVNGANGTVTLGINDIPDLTTTLAGKSATSHNHDASYSSLGHNHNAAYSALGHNHDATYEALANKGAANGYASLDSGGKVPSAQLPTTLIYSSWFGSGSDGNVTISSGTTTLTRDMFYNNLTISGTGKINAAGYRIFVAGTLDLSNAPAGAISIAPTNGNNASGATGGAAATSSPTGPFLAANTSTAGVTGTTGVGSQATAPAAITNAFGGNAGDGGAGGVSDSGPGGSSRSANAVTSVTPNLPLINFLIYGSTIPCGGAPAPGGSSGSGWASGSVSGGGGGGGAPGGGVLAIFAKTIARGASTAAGAISAKGGVGGTGGNATGFYGGGGGAGGGSGGGFVMLVFSELSGAAATGMVDVGGGAGGTGGTKGGAGSTADGSGGTGGTGGKILSCNLTADQMTLTTGASGSAPSGKTGGSGGPCTLSL